MRQEEDEDEEDETALENSLRRLKKQARKGRWRGREGKKGGGRAVG